MDNWYNKQFTRHPDKNDKPLNATSLCSCSCVMHHATSMVILTLKTLNGVFLCSAYVIEHKGIFCPNLA